jgi:hypothetical protein
VSSGPSGQCRVSPTSRSSSTAVGRGFGDVGDEPGTPPECGRVGAARVEWRAMPPLVGRRDHGRARRARRMVARRATRSRRPSTARRSPTRSPSWCGSVSSPSGRPSSRHRRALAQRAGRAHDARLARPDNLDSTSRPRSRMAEPVPLVIAIGSSSRGLFLFYVDLGRASRARARPMSRSATSARGTSSTSRCSGTSRVRSCATAAPRSVHRGEARRVRERAARSGAEDRGRHVRRGQPERARRDEGAAEGGAACATTSCSTTRANGWTVVGYSLRPDTGPRRPPSRTTTPRIACACGRRAADRRREPAHGPPTRRGSWRERRDARGARGARAGERVRSRDRGRAGRERDPRCVREDPPGAGPLAALVAGVGALGESGGAVVLLACDLPFVEAPAAALLVGVAGHGHGDPGGRRAVAVRVRAVRARRARRAAESRCARANGRCGSWTRST